MASVSLATSQNPTFDLGALAFVSVHSWFSAAAQTAIYVGHSKLLSD